MMKAQSEAWASSSSRKAWFRARRRRPFSLGKRRGQGSLSAPPRPLARPVPEQLRVVGADDQGRAVHVRAQPLGLVQPVAYELLGVLLALFQGRFALVGGLVTFRGGDGPVLDARVGAQAPVVQEGPQVLQRQLEADVPVEFPVNRVARIALLGGPDREGGDRVRARG